MTAAYADNGAAIAAERKTEKRSSAGSSSGVVVVPGAARNIVAEERRESFADEGFDRAEKSTAMPKLATGGGQDGDGARDLPTDSVVGIDRIEKTEPKLDGGKVSAEIEAARATQEDDDNAEAIEVGQTAECAVEEATGADEIDGGTSDPIDGCDVNPHDETSNRKDGHRVRKPVWPSRSSATATADEPRNVDSARCTSAECNVVSAVSWIENNDSGSPSRSRAERSSCPFETNDALKEQLQEVQRLTIRKCAAANVNNAVCGKNVTQDVDLSDDEREAYDPEAELNFYEAVRTGDARSVASLLKNGSVLNPDEPDWNVSGDPPLLVAATNHCLPVLRVLLENGCDPAVRSPRGETALHRIILNGGPGNVLKFVIELLNYGCPPAVKEAGGGSTALHVLTRQLAHAQGSKSLHHDFESALKAFDLLAKAGPVNAKDHLGRSALHILASSSIFDNNHRTEIESLINILLAAGADPSLKNDRGETPLHECLECGALNTAFLLLKHTPINIGSRYGETPLHIASRKNYVDMVASLLKHGEDPSLQDAGGNTPLHLASGRGFHQTVSLLVTSPLAQLEKVNAEGLTALQVAAESGFVNAVRLLLKAGADPSQTVHYCATTLHRHPDISVLIDHELTRRRQLAA